jgi:hypothetical protein
VADRWLVTGVRDVLDGAIPVRRILLRGHDTSRFALLLIFDPQGTFTGHPDGWLVPGLELDVDLHFYPGQPELRALIGERRAEPVPAPAPAGAAGDIAGLLDDWAAALAGDPWLGSWPALVSGTPVPADGGWRFTDDSGLLVPLVTAGIDYMLLLAISGGGPVTLAGEWSPEGLRPLTAWHGHQAVRL